MIEAQERHEKSTKKKTSRKARCGSSGGLLIYNISAVYKIVYKIRYTSIISISAVGNRVDSSYKRELDPIAKFYDKEISCEC